MQPDETIEAVTTLLRNATNLQKMNILLLHTLLRNTKDNATRLKLSTFMMKYHVAILGKIKEISDNLAPTLETQPSEIQELINIYFEMDENTKPKALTMLEAVKDTKLIPKNLSFCPNCGRFFTPTSKCKKVRIILGNKAFGTTYICKENRK